MNTTERDAIVGIAFFLVGLALLCAAFVALFGWVGALVFAGGFFILLGYQVLT